MNSLVVLAIQCTFSILVFFLIAKWYVLPKLQSGSSKAILAILLLINVFRYLPLSLFMPGQVGTEFPLYLKEIVAHGDFISGILALVALISLKSGRRSTISFVWIFSIVSIVDMAVVLTLAMSEKVYMLPLGANYFTVSVYVPMLIVVQGIILKILLSKQEL